MDKKKLQVFISSTYIDLRNERQAAVQAILSMGHIPAGMELFTAGDQSQWNVIKEWIEESDVFMLILGGRYGSIEPVSSKSYIELEYRFALEKSKPLFAVIMTDDLNRKKLIELGEKAIETDNKNSYLKFKGFVKSKMVRFCEDPKEVKLAIHETLNVFSKRENLVGWIPGNQGANVLELADQVARLAKENSQLRQKVSEYENGAVIKISDLPIEKFIGILSNQPVSIKSINELPQNFQNALFERYEDIDSDNLNYRMICEAILPMIDGISTINPSVIARNLCTLGILHMKQNNNGTFNIPELTDEGRRLFFYLNDGDSKLLYSRDIFFSNNNKSSKVEKLAKKVKPLPKNSGKNEILMKAKQIIKVIQKDKEWKSGLIKGLNPSSIKSAFSAINLTIEPIMFGFGKFVELLRFLFCDTELCIYSLPPSEIRIGFRNYPIKYFEILTDLEPRDLHSEECYKSILHSGSPSFRLPSMGELVVVCMALEKRLLSNVSLEEAIVETNSTAEVFLEADIIKYTIFGLIGAGVIDAQPETAPTSDKRFWMKKEFNTHEKMIEELFKQMAIKISSKINEPCRLEVLKTAYMFERNR